MLNRVIAGNRAVPSTPMRRHPTRRIICMAEVTTSALDGLTRTKFGKSARLAEMIGAGQESVCVRVCQMEVNDGAQMIGG